MVKIIDHVSVYSSKEYNEILKNNRFVHSMSAPGTPIKNGAMEAINERPAATLNYLTPMQYKKAYAINEQLLTI